MAEPSEMRARLARLASELAVDRGMIGALGSAISSGHSSLTADAGNGPALAYVAVQIHRYYTGIENALERIERVFGSIPSGGEWHTELLNGSALDIPGVRPPILAPHLTEPLREVLRFRHFFRHAYAVELDAAKLRRVGAIVGTVHRDVMASLEHFAAFLSAASGLPPT
jgi:hypothetical protein